MQINEKRVLLLLAALNFTHILDFMIMMPLGNLLMPFFSLKSHQFTLLVSAYAFSAGCSSFLTAFFVNDFDRKKILLTAYAGFLLGTLACGVAPTYNFLLVSRTVAGVFGGMIGAQVISIIADLIPFERRGKAMGMVMAAFAVASTFGVPFALYLANLFSWHAPFLFVGSIGFLLIPLLWKNIPPMNNHMSNSKEGRLNVFSTVLKSRNQRLALLFSGLMFMGHFIIIPFINPFLEFNKGFDRHVTPLVYLFGGISSFIAANFIGRMADIYGKWKIYLICVLASMPLVLLITHMPDFPIYIVIVIFSLWFIASTGRGVSAQALVSNIVEPESRGSFQSFNSFMQQSGTGLASIIAGLVVFKDELGILHNYTTLGYLSIIILGGTLLIGNIIFSNKPLF